MSDPGAVEAALEAALRALRHRDLSEADLERRLAGKGFDASECESAIATLRRTGIVDDRRFAESRAATLAARGSGDALIRYDLARAGIASELVEEALETLAPEEERARVVVARRGAGARTARYLSTKGFSEETVAAFVATGHAEG